MGSIKNADIKSASRALIENDISKFTKDFVHNKKTIKEMNIVDDKIVLNQMAGYITKTMKRKKVKPLDSQ